MPSDSKKKRNAKKGSATTTTTNGTGAASNGTANGASNKIVELSEEGKLLYLIVYF
jgi:hypothetical protein